MNLRGGRKSAGIMAYEEEQESADYGPCTVHVQGDVLSDLAPNDDATDAKA